MFSFEPKDQLIWFLAVGSLILIFGFALVVSIRLPKQGVKSRLAWLLLLIIRLSLMTMFWLLATDLLCWLGSCVDATSIGFIQESLIFGGVILSLGWLFSFAWVIHAKSPVASTPPKYFRWQTSIALAFPMVLFLWFCLVELMSNGKDIYIVTQRNSIVKSEFPYDFGSRFICLATGGSPERVPYLAEFTSPTDSSKKIIVVEVSFFDSSEVLFFAKTNGKRMVYLANSFLVPYSHEGSEYCFSHAQWTKDGLVFVCTLTASNGPTILVGYDFSASQPVRPLHFDGTGSIAPSMALKWNTTNVILGKLALAHGGLTRDSIDLEAIQRRKFFLPYWRIPPISTEE